MNAMATGYASDLRRVKALGIDASDISRVTGAARATVSSWMRATRRPGAAHRERLLELVAIVDRLVDVMDEDYVAIWLQKPLPALNDDGLHPNAAGYAVMGPLVERVLAEALAR